MTQIQQKNPLGTDKISVLTGRFAVPSIIAMLVSAVYNIADQLFTGNAVGTLGNAATNIAFPLSMLCTSLALLFGIGGVASPYGEAIPIACAGIVIKVNQLYFSIIIGLSQGSQPIESFNYGARQYSRVRAAYRLAASVGALVSVVAFLLFQLFPRQILSLFGTGTPEYFAFGIKYFRIFLLFTGLNFLQPISATFFSSIGKAYKGTFLSLTRQILFLLPLVLVLPHFFGIMGILYAGPVADLLSFVVGLAMVIHEFGNIQKLESETAE